MNTEMEESHNDKRVREWRQWGGMGGVGWRVRGNKQQEDGTVSSGQYLEIRVN